jgi:uncharacterized protein YbjT (DUF2867 family)
MRILVTGSAGNIRRLVRKEGAPAPKGVEVAIGDLTDPIRKALHRVDKRYLVGEGSYLARHPSRAASRAHLLQRAESVRDIGT